MEWTSLAFYIYWRLLMEAQPSGGVWRLPKPNRSDEFDSKGYKLGPDDHRFGDIATPKPHTKVNDAHWLVAESSEANAAVDALTKEVHSHVH